MDGVFDGQVVIVTGAAHGMGRAYARALARAGASVLACDVAREPLEMAVAELAADGGTAAACDASVTTPDGARSIVEAALGSFGTVDAVINNAGIMRNGYFEDVTPERLDAVLDVHVRGSFLVTQAAWPIMRAKHYGRVVMVGSAGGMFSQQGVSNYAAAKAGVYGLCKALAVEGADHGILVNTVMPMAGSMVSTDGPVPDYEQRYPQGLRAMLAPRRVVEAITPITLFLASRACQLTGEAFAAGFGRFARVFVGETPGWVADDPHAVSIQEIAEHLDEIRDLHGFTVPKDIYEDVEAIAGFLGIERG
jgi:NAD(P)-dependent dehydrogenase (short-subunit alcohol dehydrogenase family)